MEVSELPGGSNQNIQFNDSGYFGGDALFVYDKINNRVGIGTDTPLFQLDTTNDVRFNSVRVGRGGGNIITNTAFGDQSLRDNVSGVQNTALGRRTLSFNTLSYNTAVGSDALYTNVGGSNNTSVGHGSLYENINGLSNTSLGYFSLRNNTASNNTAIGFEALRFNVSGIGLTAIGYQSL